MAKNIVILIGLILIAISVVVIFDARKVVSKMFNSNEINESTKILKIAGFLTSTVVMGIILFIL